MKSFPLPPNSVTPNEPPKPSALDIDPKSMVARGWSLGEFRQELSAVPVVVKRLLPCFTFAADEGASLFEHVAYPLQAASQRAPKLEVAVAVADSPTVRRWV